MTSPSGDRDSAAANPSAQTGEYGSSRRIAFNAVIRSIGEIIAKVASVVFFIAIARELGQGTFGDFIFGLSLTGVVYQLAAFGTDELLQREIARDHQKVHTMLANVLVLRTGLLVALSGIVLAILTLSGYSAETRLAVMLIGVGVAFEYLTGAIYRVHQGYERFTYVSITLIVQRGSTAALVFAALALGGDLVDVSVAFALGALLGLVTVVLLLQRKVVRPRLAIDRERWIPLIKAGVPLGLVVLLFTALLKLDAALLGFLADDGSEEVGAYGAAYRLIEATMFLSWSFAAAILPWLARQRDDPDSASASAGPASLARGFELGLKAMTAVLLPIAVVYVLLAGPLIELFYGAEFNDAVLPLQLLAAMTVLFGVNTYASTVLIARDRPLAFAKPAAILIVQNVAFNLVAIPIYGAAGAAFNAVFSGILLAIISLRAADQVAGPASFTRALIPPTISAVAMAATILALGSGVLAVLLGGLVYIATLVAVERATAVEDFELYRGMIRAAWSHGRRARQPPGEVASLD